MPFYSGTVNVTEKPAPICPVPETGVQVRNIGKVRVYLGGEDVGNDGPAAGYPLEPGDPAQTIQGVRAKESPVVPAPPGDMAGAVLFGRTGPGAGESQVTYIAVATT